MGGHENSFPGAETPLHQNAPGCDPGFELIRKSQISCGRRSSKSNQSTIRMPLPSTLPLVQWAVPNWITHTHESTATKRGVSCRWGKQNLIGFWSKSSFWMLNQECLVPRAGITSRGFRVFQDDLTKRSPTIPPDWPFKGKLKIPVQLVLYKSSCNDLRKLLLIFFLTVLPLTPHI